MRERDLQTTYQHDRPEIAEVIPFIHFWLVTMGEKKWRTNQKNLFLRDILFNLKIYFLFSSDLLSISERIIQID